jgi:2,4-dichlorophenol 6-monooxygenase
VPIAAFVIGPARDAHDIYDDWARLRGVEETGCVLVRPDAHVAWRANEVAEDATAELGRVLDSLLGDESLVSSSVLAGSDLGRRDNGGER